MDGGSVASMLLVLRSMNQRLPSWPLTRLSMAGGCPAGGAVRTGGAVFNSVAAVAQLEAELLALLDFLLCLWTLAFALEEDEDSIRRLRGGELDIALSLAAESAPRESIDRIRLFDDPMHVALPRDHRHAGRPKLRLRDLADEPWMLGSTSTCPDTQMFKRACHAAGFEPTIAFENDDYHAILGFVAGLAMMAVAVLSGYQRWAFVLLFLVFWRLVQDYVISPRIMGARVELHPLAALFGILAGGEIAGVLGVYLSIPVMASLRIVWRRWRIYAEKRKFGPLNEYSFPHEITPGRVET